MKTKKVKKCKSLLEFALFGKKNEVIDLQSLTVYKKKIRKKSDSPK